MPLFSIFNSSVSDFRIWCNGAEISCTYSDGVIQADPDIAGIGVIISFILTSVITFVAIIIGYFTYSIDDGLTNEIDAIAVRSVRLLLGMGDGKNIPIVAKKTRKEALTRFVLTLSDQQLVTGLAMLITGYYRRCSISGYHFTLVGNLAWFSSTTHLSTLAVLHCYLMEHPVLKTWRFASMCCLLGLLFHAELYIQWIVPWSLPILCTFEAGFPYLNSSATANFLTFTNVMEWVAIVAFLFFAYGNNMIMRQWLRLSPSSHAEEIASKRTWLRSLIRRTRLLQSINLFWDTFQRSFLWEIVWMTFGNVFGLIQISRTRWASWVTDSEVNVFTVLTATVEGSENVMSFGQMVSLLLLAIPLLAAGEAYCDVKGSVTLASNTRIPIINSTAGPDPRLGQHSRQIPLVQDVVASKFSALKIGVFTAFMLAGLVFFAVEAGYYWDFQDSVTPVILVAMIMYFVTFIAACSILGRLSRLVLDLRERSHGRQQAQRQREYVRPQQRSSR